MAARLLVVSVLAIVAVSGVSGHLNATTEAKEIAQSVRSSSGDGWFKEYFDEGVSGLLKNWWFSGRWANGPPFDAGFDPSFYGINKYDVLELYVQKKAFRHPTGDHDFTAGEIKSKKFYGPGCYSVCMKPSSQLGTSSSFYAFSGQYDSDPPRNAQDSDLKFHNEIDIEFVGKNTSEMQSNYFSKRDWRADPNLVETASGVEEHHALGFDAATGFHAYAFRWVSWGIQWYADGRLLRTVYRSDDPNMPDPAYGPLRVTANVWIVDKNSAGWAGAVREDFSFGLSEYAWIRYDSGESCNIVGSCGF